MAIVNEVSNPFTGAAGFGLAQTIDGSAFDCTGTGDDSTFYPLSPTASIVGTISTIGDEDYYRVFLVGGQTIRLDIDGTNGVPQDMVVTGFAPNGAQTFIADDNPNGLDPGSTTNQDSFTEFVVGVSGFWTFKVSTFQNVTFGPYTLHITNLSLPIDAYGSAGADLKVGAATADMIRGFAPGQEAADLGNDTLRGMAGNDTLLGGGGNDFLDGGFDNDSLQGGLGDDTLLGNGGPGSDTLQGGDGNDSLYGGDGVDLLQGGIGNDTLIGDPFGPPSPAKIETLQGGEGADSIEGGAGDDSLTGGAGNDTIWGGYFSQVDLHSGQNTLSGGDGADSLVGSNTGSSAQDGIDLVLGGAGNDTILGGSGADRLFGNDGDDSIDGARGIQGDSQNDLVDGGAGNDTLLGGWYDRLRGGDGNDDIRLTLQVGQPQKMPFVDAGAGTDTLTLDIVDGNIKRVTFDGSVAGQASVTFNSDLSTTPIRGVWYGFETYFVEGSDQPDGFNDLLVGGAGNDTLYAGGGAGDLLNGGAGNDLLSTLAINGLVASTDVQMLGGLGNDTLEFVTPSGSATPASGFGDGGAGNDSLVAGSAILPAVGSVFLDGGGGADTVSVFSGDVVADGGLGADLLVVTQTTSAALTVMNLLGDIWALSATLAIQFSGFERYQLTGAGADDLLYGGDGADTLDGGVGNDSLFGGLGNDLYIVDQVAGATGPGDVLTDDGGVDTVQASLDWTLADGFENLTLTGAAIAGTGNGVGNKLTGSTLGNLLSGLGGNDSIDGGDGDDTLLGGDGTDTLTGGAGADRFRFISPTGGTDRITDFVTGTDKVQFSAAGFTGLVAGVNLQGAGLLVLGTVANAANPQLLLDVPGGRIFWDADGTGATAKVLVATLTGLPPIAASDLEIIS